MLTWAKKAPGGWFGYKAAVELPDHRILTAGTYSNVLEPPVTATFGPGEPGQIVLDQLPGTTIANGMHTFLAWYNADGTASNARALGRAESMVVSSLVLAPGPSAILCGSFAKQMEFGPLDPNPVTFTHGPMSTSLTQDAWLAKYSY